MKRERGWALCGRKPRETRLGSESQILLAAESTLSDVDSFMLTVRTLPAGIKGGSGFGLSLKAEWVTVLISVCGCWTSSVATDWIRDSLKTSNYIISAVFVCSGIADCYLKLLDLQESIIWRSNSSSWIKKGTQFACQHSLVCFSCFLTHGGSLWLDVPPAVVFKETIKVWTREISFIIILAIILTFCLIVFCINCPEIVKNARHTFLEAKCLGRWLL